ncbi:MULTISPECIES: hypothetical protein [unclassified Tolypothrix]|nr:MULTISPECIES: hypothetical protein [unclassified Tolypothrix]EKF02022.1 hypothetical protein FDUTEX481_07273 [Tolypothrix sp. PCC 7601]
MSGESAIAFLGVVVVRNAITFLGLMGKLHQYIIRRGTASTDFR